MTSGPSYPSFTLAAGDAPSNNLLAPVWSATISSPVTLAGTGVAYEGTIQAQVRQDDRVKSLGESNVTEGEWRSVRFNGTLAFTNPAPSAQRRCSPRPQPRAER